MAPQRHRGAKGCRAGWWRGERVQVGPGEVPGEPRWIQVRFQVGADRSGWGAGGPRWAQVRFHMESQQRPALALTPVTPSVKPPES